MKLRGRSLVASLSAALMLGTTMVSVAGGEGVPEDPTATPNTAYTPVPQPYDAERSPWEYVGGLRFNATTGQSEAVVPATSPTPATVNFYGVGFSGPGFGFAGGSRCADTTDLSDPRKCDAAVPTIWRYVEAADGTARWEEDPTFPKDGTGFVAAIAFFPDGQRALAVGGTGTYPYREQAFGEADPAGQARAWEYARGQWHELVGLSAQMRGLTALALSPREGDCGSSRECGFAGGFRQLWRWTDNGFSQTPENVTGGIAYRVRAIRFRPGTTRPPGDIAVMVTSGCCAAQTSPRVPGASALLSVGTVFAFNQAWSGRNVEGLPDSAYDLFVGNNAGGGWYASLALSPGAPEGSSAYEPTARVAGALVDGNTSGVPLFDAVLGPDLNNNRNGSELGYELANPRVGAIDLAAGDGDSVSAPLIDGYETGGRNRTPSPGADGFIDWAVGRQRSNGQGLAFTTTADPHTGPRGEVPDPLACTGDGVLSAAALDALAKGQPPDPTQCQADQAVLDQESSKAVFLLPTYGLNDYTITDTGDVGWAVGDRGAIVRLGAGASTGELAKAEPDPAALGSARPAPVADTRAYDAFAPLPARGEPGMVPTLANRPLLARAERQLLPGGSPDPARLEIDTDETVAQMALSRDGSEGWAVGSPNDTNPTALFHYVEGAGWRRCATTAKGTQLPPDRACGILPRLAEYRDDFSKRGVRIIAISRIPMEHGDDPAVADDFQAVALGTSYRPASGIAGAGVLLRFEDGRWQIDETGSRQLNVKPDNQTTSIAFASPDDGWLSVKAGAALRHYRGPSQGWADCGSGSSLACADPAPGRLKSFDKSTVRFALAGRRLYAFGSQSVNGVKYLLVLYRDTDKPCEKDGDAGCWHSADGGLDPVASGQQSDTSLQGSITDLSVARSEDGSYSGWMVGSFGQGQTASALLHLEADGAGGHRWVPWTTHDASSAYLLVDSVSTSLGNGIGQARLVTLAGQHGEGRTILVPSIQGQRGPLLEYDPVHGRWRVLPAPFSLIGNPGDGVNEALANVFAMAPDGRGGSWLAVLGTTFADDHAGHVYHLGTYFYHYTAEVREPVFEDVAHPVREPIVSAAGGGDGSLWVATASDRVYRYDRVGGWSSVAVRGWDGGRLVTRSSVARAIAVGSDGRGIVVGDRGRVADISPTGVVLDAAVSARCLQAPCHGTTRDLHAAAVAPDGAVMAAGKGRALLWRPPGGDFTALDVTAIPATLTFTGVTFPTPDHVWLSTARGHVVAGVRTGSDWTWAVEDLDVTGKVLNRGPTGISLPLNAIAVDASGHGYAVGDHGLLLERTGEGSHAWRRLDTGVLSNFWSVALPPGGGPGALIGGQYGLVLTETGHGRFAVAHELDPYDGLVAGPATAASRVVGVAVLPGSRAGQVEAWAAEQMPFAGEQGRGIGHSRMPAPGAILHYTSDPSDPLLSAGGRASPWPDSVERSPGEIAFAAFGKSECNMRADCPEITGSNRVNELIARRVVEQIARDADQPDGPAFALFTGDASDSAGSGGTVVTDLPTSTSVVHENWRDLVADRLTQAGTPVFAALGGQDLSRLQFGNGPDGGSSRLLNDSWRAAFSGMPAPWGKTVDAPASDAGVSFEPVAATGVPSPTGGARTHYAFDVIRDGEALLRVVVIDSSRGSVDVSDATQNPIESQTEWLTRVLRRPDGVKAVVVSETPSYSYGPGATSDTLTDSAAFENLMMTNRVDAVVSGRLGWNALYWMTAAGVHSPCPGGSYPEQAPDPDAPQPCMATGDDAPQAPDPSQQAKNLASVLQGPGVAPPAVDPTGTVQSTGATGLVATVVAASAGGKFGPSTAQQPAGIPISADSASSGDGNWHGYSAVRLAPGRLPVIEQRPVFDWIGLTAATHVLRPGQRMTLRGYGREPVGTDAPIVYHDEIDSPAITHRYNLLAADPAKPWLPKVVEGNGNPHGYVPLDPTVAIVDPVTGRVTAQRSNHGRVFGIALLSVGDKAATWPLVMEPKRSLVVKRPPTIATPPIPDIKVLPLNPASLTPPATTAPPAPPPPIGTTLQVPAPPAIPGLPIPGENPAVPPVPPAPPAPPASHNSAPLSLTIGVTGVSVPPTTGVAAQPTPPVNPSPPGGARKEAKQRQAATAKSEEGGGQGAGSEAHGRIDPVDSPNASATRLSPRRGEPHAFTALPHAEQVSAWTIGLQWGGGIGLMALALALGFTTLRPTPRGRRAPELPAPAYVRRRR